MILPLHRWGAKSHSMWQTAAESPLLGEEERLLDVWIDLCNQRQPGCCRVDDRQRRVPFPWQQSNRPQGPKDRSCRLWRLCCMTSGLLKAAGGRLTAL